jgi:hypothetical protein
VQGPTTTTEFRSPPVNRPEQTLVGIQFSMQLPNNTDYIVTNSSHWVYAGTGFRDGDVVPGIVGYELDSYMPSYPSSTSTNQTLLSRSPYTDPGSGVTGYANSSIYQAPSGAWVFAAGTMSWSWALDDIPGGGSHFRVDSRIQRATANILNAFLRGVPPTITSFTPVSGRVGTAVTLNGMNFTGATSVAFSGTAANFSVTSDTTIQATVPTEATTGPLSATGPGGTATSSTAFTVRRTLSVTRTGLRRGTVTSSPAGIQCGGTCSADFDSGTVVTLTATPAFLSMFSGWSGCDTASGNICTVTMDASRSVIANFLP